jgi:hypothetical protein
MTLFVYNFGTYADFLRNECVWVPSKRDMTAHEASDITNFYILEVASRIPVSVSLTGIGPSELRY